MIDSKWQEAFIIECRARGYTGDAIGEALAEVESHCVSANQSPQEAIGDPTQYAASLDLAKDSSGIGAVLVGSALGLAALTVLPAAVVGLVRGQPAVLTSGQLIIFGIILAIVALIFFNRETLGKLVRNQRPWVVGLASVALIGLWVGIMFMVPHRISINSPLLALIGAVALIGSMVADWATDPDPVASPFEAKPTGSAARWLMVALWPALTAVFTGLAFTT